MNNILVIGDAMLDHYTWNTIERMSPEDSSAPVLDFYSEDFRLGGCTNVAANLKSLCPKNTITVFSVLSKKIINLLNQKDINYFISPCPPETPIIKKRLINITNNKQLARLDNKMALSKESLLAYENAFKYVNLNHFNAIVVSDYNKGVINKKIVEFLHPCSQPIFIDTKKADLSIWSKLKTCYVKVNQTEYESSINSESLQNLIVTQRDKGAVWQYKDLSNNTCRKTHYPTTIIEDPEVTGCGDVFLAGLVTNFLKTNSLSDSIEYANHVAGINAKSYGTTEVKYER